MKLFFRPTSGPDDWKSFLAEPDKQWKPGYSAHSLAHCWESAGDLPAAVRTVFEKSKRFRGFELLLAIPEVQVALPGGRRPSQTDLWLLGSVSDGLVSVAVEGKVSEPFGQTIETWQIDASPGKAERLSYLLDMLHMKSPASEEIRYQLLHRTVSALLLAQRFHARHAVMLVHSFSPSDDGIEDYRAFATALGSSGPLEGIIEVPGHENPTLSLGWARDKVGRDEAV